TSDKNGSNNINECKSQCDNNKKCYGVVFDHDNSACYLKNKRVLNHKTKKQYNNSTRDMRPNRPR
ncbi:MAG TPA: hypothetical protein EYQ00_00515, partial [Dehalococcoidia bacterium]|nr:hypothetical protein [Dehalococcoidia bacterium]